MPASRRTSLGSSEASAAETGRSLDRNARSPAPSSAPPAAAAWRKVLRLIRVDMGTSDVGNRSRPRVGVDCNRGGGQKEISRRGDKGDKGTRIMRGACGGG